MKEKFLKSLISRSLIVIILALCISCKKEKKINEDPLHWSVCMNAPQNYHALHPMVTVCHKGSLMGGVSINFIGDSWGWSGIDLGESIVDTRYTPDSLFIEWTDYFDGCRYNLPLKLPSKKLDSLFHSTYKGLKNRKERYNEINVGMAPGGRVCVFVNKVELLRAKAKNIGTDSIFNNKKYSPDINEYWNHHLLDYTLWDKPDSSYELDFGFCSEGGSDTFVFADLTSKEGVLNTVDSYYLDEISWGIPYGKSSDYEGDFYSQLNQKDKEGLNKLQLPVHILLSWERKSSNQLFCTDVVLSKDFSKRFTTSYTNPKTGKSSNYNRIVFGVEKDGEHGVIWLDGPNKQEKLMRFKGYIAKRSKDNGIESGGYATEVTYY